jgi:glucose-6-phosphate isomerase
MLTYTPTHFFADTVTGGITVNEVDTAELHAVYAHVQSEKREGKLGFVALPGDTEAIATIQRMADEMRPHFKQLIVIGIGGPDLGTRAAFRALCSPHYNASPTVRGNLPQLFFAGDTTDPAPLLELCEIINWPDTLIIMISKSGNTLEQMASFTFLRQQLIDAVGAEQARDHILTITDATEGTLREITNEEGYKNLVVPKTVGGRFAVLSSVGLFPLAMVGIDIAALCKGAADFDATEGSEPSLPAQFAWHQSLAARQGKDISVMFPYGYGLREFGQWFRQLWAESLGKKMNKAGEVVNAGPTAIAALGPTDQHSQVQLYMEGPNNKIMTFIRTKEALKDIILPEAFPNKDGVRYLAGLSMHRILNTEQESTAEALAHEGRVSTLIEIDRMDAYHLGQLFYFFELATAYAGEFWDVNAYDQPGVELGKQLMYKKLGRY